MRVTFTVSGRDPEAQALLRHLASAARVQSTASFSAFPFSLLEYVLRAVLAGLERLVASLVDTVAAGLRFLRRTFKG